MPIPHSVYTGFVPFKTNPWEPYYTFRPRRIRGRWYWLEQIYRRWHLSPGGGFWEYGDVLDFLRDC